MADGWAARLLAGDASAAASLAAAVACRAVADCNELFVGGDDSPQLLQLLAARGEDGALDVMASVLDPGASDAPEVVFSARGAEALALVACFWDARPSAPLLLVSGGVYLPLHCSLPDKPWTERRLSASAVALLQQQGDESERLQVLLPAAPVPGERWSCPPRLASCSPAMTAG
jgi:hypothetical protein